MRIKFMHSERKENFRNKTKKLNNVDINLIKLDIIEDCKQKDRILCTILSSMHLVSKEYLVIYTNIGWLQFQSTHSFAPRLLQAIPS